MIRLLALTAVLVLAGCGGGGTPDGYDTRDLGGGWRVLWKPDGSDAYVEREGEAVPQGKIELRAVGPDQGETVGTVAQVAAEVRSAGIVDDALLLVDGEPVPDLKGGGLSDKRITIYGTVSSLSPGRHVAVVVAREGETGAAESWTFTVR